MLFLLNDFWITEEKFFILVSPLPGFSFSSMEDERDGADVETLSE